MLLWSLQTALTSAAPYFLLFLLLLLFFFIPSSYYTFYFFCQFFHHLLPYSVLSFSLSPSLSFVNAILFLSHSTIPINNLNNSCFSPFPLNPYDRYTLPHFFTHTPLHSHLHVLNTCLKSLPTASLTLYHANPACCCVGRISTATPVLSGAIISITFLRQRAAEELIHEAGSHLHATLKNL
ncbi:hypothetical protein E2C01_058674 [Portunus trituberculatus]|uniref:Uncharacterized protein n=1 Tax=Portunus trituberculatus TaxID=210409 RepID=A0A5B7H3T8_PORTR|nr:hypothetical protein [Portunus trituberculatus]